MQLTRSARRGSAVSATTSPCSALQLRALRFGRPPRDATASSAQQPAHAPRRPVHARRRSRPAHRIAAGNSTIRQARSLRHSHIRGAAPSNAARHRHSPSGRAGACRALRLRARRSHQLVPRVTATCWTRPRGRLATPRHARRRSQPTPHVALASQPPYQRYSRPIFRVAATHRPGSRPEPRAAATRSGPTPQPLARRRGWPSPPTQPILSMLLRTVKHRARLPQLTDSPTPPPATQLPTCVHSHHALFRAHPPSHGSATGTFSDATLRNDATP